MKTIPFSGLKPTLKRATLVDCGLLLALAVLPFWRAGWGIWEAYDQGFLVHPVTGLYQSLYVWNDLAGTGSATGIITSIFLPFRVLIAGLSLTGLPLGVLQRIIDVVFFAAAGWGMYYFVTSVFSFEDDSKRRIAAVSSAIPYMFNLFIPYWLLIGAFPEYPLVALPYLVAFLYKGIRSDRARDWLKYAVLLGVSLSFLATSPEFFIIVVFALAPLVLYIVISGLKAGRRRQVVSGLKFLAVGSLVSIGMNSYWLVVNAFSIFQFNSIGAAVSQSPGLQRVLSFFDAPNVVVQSYRTVAWIVPLNAPVTPLNFWVLDPSWMALGLVLAATSFLALLFRPREKKTIGLALMLVVALGFSSGIGPFRAIYTWFYNEVPLFSVLSDPHKFFLLLLFALSALVGLAIAELYSRLRFKSIRQVMVLVTLALLLANAYPLLAGNMFGALNGVTIPGYYSEAGEWLSAQGSNYRVAGLPTNLLGTSTGYSWAPYPIAGSVYWATQVLSVPVLDLDYPSTNSAWWASTAINTFILDNRTNQLGKTLTLWNIKYLIIAHDTVNPANNASLPTSDITSFASRQKDLKYVQSFGALDLYENEVWSDSTFLASSTYVTFGNQFNLTAFQLASEVSGFEPNGVVILPPVSTGVVSQRVFNLSNYPTGTSGAMQSVIESESSNYSQVRLSYTKMDPSNYLVHISATHPFVLVFESTYDPAWEATMEGTSSPLAHLEVDNYANGWYVPTSGSMTIIVHEAAQPYLTYGIVFSLASWILSVSILGMAWTKPRKPAAD